MYSAYKLNKQGDNVQPWCTPFPIWNQSVVPCPVLTVVSWPAYRFLKREVRWSGIPMSFRIFHSLLCRSVVSKSLWPHGLYSPCNSPGQNTEVGSLSLLQGIFPTQGLNPGLLCCRWILYQLSYKGSPLRCKGQEKSNPALSPSRWWESSPCPLLPQLASGWVNFRLRFLLSCTMEIEMASHSSVLALRIPGTGEPGGLPSMGLHGVGHDWSDLGPKTIKVSASKSPIHKNHLAAFLRPRGIFAASLPPLPMLSSLWIWASHLELDI